MKITPKAEKPLEKFKKKGDLVELLFFIALNVLVVPFSTYQTFVGYEKDVAGNAILALIVAAISGVFFLAMNYVIRESRLNGEKHFWKVLMYIVPLAISVPGNFNAFYSNQMKGSLLRQEINSYRLAMTSTKDVALSSIEVSIGLNDLETTFKSKLNTLEREYDTKPKGWGKNCISLWKDLCDFLNKQGGSINANSISSITNEQLKFNKAKAFAEAEFGTIKNTRSSSIKPTIDYINTTFVDTDAVIDSLINLSTPVYRSSMLDKMVTVENLIRSKTESFLSNSEVFPHDPLKSSNENEIGTIKHSFNSAFIKWESTTATVFSLFLSLIIDFAALLYILVFIPYNKTTGGGNKGRLTTGPKRI